MDAQGSSPLSDVPEARPFRRGRLGGLSDAAAAAVVAAGGDIALIIDLEGVIRDMSVSNDDMARDGATSWLDQRWSDTVTLESRHKIDALLRDALANGQSRWREVNQVTPSVNSMMIRYLAVDAGRGGDVIAIGRDDRGASAAHERLIEAHQAMERDYSRLRDAESRYRLLFDMSGEPVIIVDATSKRIIDANPAAERAIGEIRSKLAGESFAKIFDPQWYDEAASLLTIVKMASPTNCAQMRLTRKGQEFTVSASLFRQDRAIQCLVRLAPAEPAQGAAGDSGPLLRAVLEQMPDAFLVADESLRIITANTAFLDLVRIATRQQAIGLSLNAFLGRPGLDRNLLIESLREHGSVRNFSTVIRNRHEGQEDVEVSAVSVPADSGAVFGFTIRSVRRRQGDRSQSPPELRRSVEQLTELVGRVKLKELVRETTDLVERLCIEAALELTKDNRASAADVLGLSRQSLYSKLHRFGLGNLNGSDD
jgi:transcriptional regulator PpsR